jgi:hypothetical protein
MSAVPTGGPQVVAADGQFGITHILRPYPNFEADYQGTAVANSIMLTEGGEPRDAQAGKPGYDPNLIKGLPVPLGSRVQVWLPSIVSSQDANNPYYWQIIWRMRNTFDYRQTRRAFHYPKQSAGINGLVVIPAAPHTIIYNQPEPTDLNNNMLSANQHMWSEAIITTRLRVNVLVPTATPGAPVGGFIEQGIQTLPIASFQSWDVQCIGDEFLIGLKRAFDNASPTKNWDFTQPAGPDAAVSKFLGNGSGTDQFKDIGVYVLTGSAP